jgi:hypothetical protein
MEVQSILSPYPCVSFPMSVDKSFRGKNLSTVNNEDTISVYLDSSENHPLFSTRLYRLQVYFEDVFIVENCPTNVFAIYVLLYFLSACDKFLFYFVKCWYLISVKY